jgi:hypothetical protein
MSNKDDITIDDIAIDLGDYGAQESTMIDSLDTITITGSGLDQYSSANSSNFTYGGATVGGITTATLPSASTYTIGAAGSTLYSTGIGSYNWGTTTSPTVNITGDGIDMAAGTDIKIDGKSLKNFIDKMEERLAILVPDPAKLERFEALKKAYDHYKLMESLCQELPKEED